MRRIFALLLLVCLALTSVSCADNSTEGGEGTWESGYTYNPYYNRFKPNVPTARDIAVTGSTYYFSYSEVRDKDEKKLVNQEDALNILYAPVELIFPAENKVRFKDTSGFFNLGELEGKREGNVITVKDTNELGTASYDIRIEIHSEDLVYVIHNGHHYDEPCTYATLRFESLEALEKQS